MKIDLKDILPHDGESPSAFAERIGVSYSLAATSVSKKSKGQFFTPLSIAHFMSTKIVNDKNKITILDPGCGTAILSSALIEHLLIGISPKEITLVLYETDFELIPFLVKVVDYLKLWLQKKDVFFTYEINQSDFILDNSTCLDSDLSLFGGASECRKYDFIISNPPYFKLSKDDPRVRASLCITDGQPNIYSIFMAISAGLLSYGGKMVFIVPRSFTSGRYFRAFRNYFLDKVNIELIHLFNTRSGTFSKDNVLQETLILVASLKNDKKKKHITISFSEGIGDLFSPVVKEHLMDEVVDCDSKEKIIHLPVNSHEEEVVKLFKSWTGSLNMYNIQISTGPVVAFRSKDFIIESQQDGAVPLYWLHNVVKMLADHPINKKDKGQYILVNNDSYSMLLPNKNYIFLRRFSSKDDTSRLVAAPYFGNMSEYSLIGVENKLNYIYRPKGHLDRFEVMGLCGLLNSELFDLYFRTFNGNVNVSATELRQMPLPDLHIIKEIGRKLVLMNDFSLENISFVINKFFKVSK